MEQDVRSDNNGFTLIEVLVAMVIIIVALLGLVQATLLSIDYNLRNLLRDEAVRIAEQRMDEARNLAFTETADNLVNDSTDSSLNANICPANFITNFGQNGVRISRDFKNINFDFCTNRNITVIDSNNKQVTITVGWRWKGEDYTHTISTIMRKS